MHLVGVITRIYQDAPSLERQIWNEVLMAYSEVAVYPQSDWTEPQQPQATRVGILADIL